ncbi:glycosyltransferase family 2 protein [Capnocytophaga canis]|uniref:glycosyltransferase family 2 protein n=1 Tax=Capnocytophaga canis TaxID=1848903 RepID=UPI00370D5428
MEGRPLVSVLIPCYNVEKYVVEAVMSIINQTYDKLEIILIDDGSTDDTTKLLKKMAKQDKRVIFVQNDKNIGLIDTLNKGLQICSGKYVARMDSDDISLPQRIERQVQFLEKNKDIGIVGSYIQFFGEKKGVWRMETEDRLIKSSLFYTTCFAHPSVMFRNDVVKKNQLKYDRKYIHAEDYKLWYDFSKCTKMANLPVVLLKYRINKNQVSQKFNDIQHKNTVKIRKTIINSFLAQNSIILNINEKIRIEQIKKGEIRKGGEYLLLVFYASSCGTQLFKLFHLFISFDFLRLKFKNIVRLIYWILKDKNKYLLG